MMGFVWSNSAGAQDAALSEQLPDQPQAKSNQQEGNDVPVAEMPSDKFFLGKEFWYPNRFNVTESLRDANTHYRKGQLRAAQGEIKEAVTWLQIVKANAGAASKVQIETVIVDLLQVADELDGEKSISAKRLNLAFAKANLALARHNFSVATKLTEQSDLMNASRRLVAAADHMKNAAYSADISPSPIVGTFRDEYSPFGMVNETLEPTPVQLKDDLEKLALALKDLGAKMQDRAVE